MFWIDSLVEWVSKSFVDRMTWWRDQTRRASFVIDEQTGVNSQTARTHRSEQHSESTNRRRPLGYPDDQYTSYL